MRQKVFPGGRVWGVGCRVWGVGRINRNNPLSPVSESPVSESPNQARQFLIFASGLITS
ncbi:hypothetical protein RVR34_14265 [Microcystis aeruginosa FBCC-A68]|uniref:hypothetical protein n=1 Tax=Microcystis aeruginosa TaxID=1126 RepID=UPI001483BB34|nr:hypothetical protein [Microcystis aeruginosa]